MQHHMKLKRDTAKLNDSLNDLFSDICVFFGFMFTLDTQIYRIYMGDLSFIYIKLRFFFFVVVGQTQSFKNK